MKQRVAMGAVTLASVSAYLGLAVLGWGGFGPFFSHPARVALVVVTYLLAAAAIASPGNLSAGEREDRGNRWTLDGDGLRWAGVALYALGGALRVWPVFVLGRRFSGLVAIQPGHQLVTDGIYRVIRHPSYLGLLAGSFGWALGFRSTLGVLLA